VAALGKRCAAAAGRVGAAGEVVAPAAAAPQKNAPPPSTAEADALRLFANAYALHVTHLTTGVRIGAAAAEALGLFARGATGLYDSYDDGDEGGGGEGGGGGGALPTLTDPLRHFRARVDGVGPALPAWGWAIIEAELVGAVQRAGGLFEPLASDE
jgi:hypothetical protein